MKSPIQVRRSGDHIAVCIRVVTGPRVTDTRQLCVGAKGSASDGALVASLRRKLAASVAECISRDEWPDTNTETSASTGREYGADKTGEPNIPASSATGDASLRRSEAAPTAPGDIPPPGGGVFLFPKWLPYLLAGASIVVSVGALLGWW